MGQHTWFSKDKTLYLKQNALHEKLDAFEKGYIYLDNLDVYQINSEIDELDKQNKAEYHDVFRTSKRNADSTYTDDEIFSKEECFEWINKPENKVYFKNTIFDTDEKEKIARKQALIDLNDFWDKYPNGVINFG